MFRYRMGFDQDRFETICNDKLICSSSKCKGVVEDPVQCSKGQHLFCKKCLLEEYLQKGKCPKCHSPAAFTEVEEREGWTKKPIFEPANIVRMIAYQKMDIKCRFFKNGCKVTRKIRRIAPHEALCNFNCSPHVAAMIKMKNSEIQSRDEDLKSNKIKIAVLEAKLRSASNENTFLIRKLSNFKIKVEERIVRSTALASLDMQIANCVEVDLNE